MVNKSKCTAKLVKGIALRATNVEIELHFHIKVFRGIFFFFRFANRNRYYVNIKTTFSSHSPSRHLLWSLSLILTSPHLPFPLLSVSLFIFFLSFMVSCQEKLDIFEFANSKAWNCLCGFVSLPNYCTLNIHGFEFWIRISSFFLLFFFVWRLRSFCTILCCFFYLHQRNNMIWEVQRCAFSRRRTKMLVYMKFWMQLYYKFSTDCLSTSRIMILIQRWDWLSIDSSGRTRIRMFAYHHSMMEISNFAMWEFVSTSSLACRWQGYELVVSSWFSRRFRYSQIRFK